MGCRRCERRAGGLGAFALGFLLCLRRCCRQVFGAVVAFLVLLAGCDMPLKHQRYRSLFRASGRLPAGRRCAVPFCSQWVTAETAGAGMRTGIRRLRCVFGTAGVFYRYIEVANFDRIESTGLLPQCEFGHQISTQPSGIQAKTASLGKKNAHPCRKKRNFLAILFTFY